MQPWISFRLDLAQEYLSREIDNLRRAYQQAYQLITAGIADADREDRSVTRSRSSS